MDTSSDTHDTTSDPQLGTNSDPQIDTNSDPQVDTLRPVLRVAAALLVLYC